MWRRICSIITSLFPFELDRSIFQQRSEQEKKEINMKLAINE
jgi:hypothetical protein